MSSYLFREISLSLMFVAIFLGRGLGLAGAELRSLLLCTSFFPLAASYFRNCLYVQAQVFVRIYSTNCLKNLYESFKVRV